MTKLHEANMHPTVQTYLHGLNEVSQRNTVRRGALSKLIACAWLLETGWEVFSNVGPTGWADVVAWRIDHGAPVLINVKTVRYNQSTSRLSFAPLRDREIQAGIVPLFVTDDGVCSFDWKNIQEKYRALAIATA